MNTMEMKKKYLSIALFMIGTLPMSSQVSSDNEDGVNKIEVRYSQQDFVPGQVLMKFKDSNRVRVRQADGRFSSVSLDHVSAVLEKHGVEQMEQLLPNENPNRKFARARSFNGDIIEERDLSQLYLLKLSDDHQQETMQIVNELNAIDEVEYAEPNYRAYMMGESYIADSYGTNFMYNQQWYLDAYGVTDLWNKPIINPERPVIAIIDTGVDTTHPDLKDNCIEGYDFVNDTPNVIDDNMHGTHVAGIAAACDNETGIVGANPKALIMPVKVLNSSGAGDNATVLRGVTYAVEHGAKILNLSLGGYGYSKAAADVYRNASLKAVIVAAAGNDGKCLYSSHTGLQKHGTQPAPSFPGAYSFVLGVQATNREGKLASFSNYDDDGPLFSCESSIDEPDGFNYELKAPGIEILSTLPNGNYGELQGTSMASPLVAGAISALMMVKKYDSQERLWAELLHTNNILEAYELKELPADLDVVRIMLRQRKEFSDETEEAYSGNNEVKAGETVKIYPVVRCTSGEASNIKLKLGVDENEDPNSVQILTGEADFGWHLDAMGKGVSKNPLILRIPENIADSRHIRMKITVSCENQEGSNHRSFNFIANNMETISGLLSENTTLHSGHTYYVENDLLVDEGVTLTIEPGTRLEFAKGKSLASKGKLVAKGTLEKPIVLTSHHGGEKWDGFVTRKKTGEEYVTGLYTNSDHSLFTLYRTEATPIFLSECFREYRFFDTSHGFERKTFNLEDYIRGWDIYKTLLGNVHGDESLLSDPNFLTPAVRKMLGDYYDYLEKYGTVERTETNTDYISVTAELLRWRTYSNYGDTIAYCRIENCEMAGLWKYSYNYSYPYMENCIITGGRFPSSGISVGGKNLIAIEGVRNVVTECDDDSGGSHTDGKYWNIINNNGSIPLYSSLIECNYFNNPVFYNFGGDSRREYWLGTRATEPEVDHADYPSYLGTSHEDIVRPHIYELGNAPDGVWGTIDLSNMRKEPVREAHGIVWKVLVNGKDAQDEHEDLAPLGVGRHRFDVYFNRPMNKAVEPKISFGVRDPWTQNGVDENGSWNAEGTIYTAYVTVTGKTKSDGINRIYVRGAEDDEFFPCPYEKSRFNINVQTAGSMATGFAAEASVGRVNLTWNNENNDFEDAMGFNVYRYSNDVKKTIPGHYDDNWHWIGPVEIPDTIRINEDILGIETCEYTDYDVIPNHTYYYLYKVLSTDLKEYDLSNIVAATPLTAIIGDANGSGDIDVVDVITTVNYAVGLKPNPFIFDAADVNADKNIDVLDVIGIVQKVLNPNSASVTSLQEHHAVYSVEDGILYVESPVALGGVQVQIYGTSCLNEKGQMVNDQYVTTSDLDGFEKASAWLSDEDYLLIAYSLTGKTMAAGRHALLDIGDAEISQLRLCDANGHNVKVVAGQGTTNIETMGSRVMRQKGVYDLQGRKLSNLRSPFSTLKKGVYIIDGKKVVK